MPEWAKRAVRKEWRIANRYPTLSEYLAGALFWWMIFLNLYLAALFMSGKVLDIQ